MIRSIRDERREKHARKHMPREYEHVSAKSGTDVSVEVLYVLVSESARRQV